MRMLRDRVSIIQAVLIILSLVLLSSLAFSTLQRIFYPFELEWMEGAMVDHVARVLQGRKVYVPPTLDFVPFIYPPGFYLLSAAIAKVTGLGFLPLRLVSLLATIGSLTCVYAFVVREGGRRLPGLVAMGFFAGTYPLSGFFFDLARVDSLFLCLVLWCGYLVRFGRGRSALILAAVLLTAAYFTKQSALVLAFPLLIYLLKIEPRRGLWFGGVTLLLVLGLSIAVDTVHQGWFGFYTHRVVAGHLLVLEMTFPFLRGEILFPCGLALGLSVFYWLFGSPISKPGGKGFHGLFFAALLLMAWMGRVHSGGWINVLLPAHAGIAIVFGLGLGTALGEPTEGLGGRFRWIGPILACLQLTALLWNPLPTIPTHDDRRAGDELVRKLRAVEGSVWMTHRGYLPSFADKSSRAHMMAVLDVMRSRADFRGAKSRLTSEVEEAFASGRFELVLLDNHDFWYLPALEDHYQRDGIQWFDNPHAFWPRAGARLRPELGYVRKPSHSDKIR